MLFFRCNQLYISFSLYYSFDWHLTFTFLLSVSSSVDILDLWILKQFLCLNPWLLILIASSSHRQNIFGNFFFFIFEGSVVLLQGGSDQGICEGDSSDVGPVFRQVSRVVDQFILHGWSGFQNSLDLSKPLLDSVLMIVWMSRIYDQ